MIRKLEKIKHYRVLKNSTGGGQSRKNLQWVTQGKSCERSIKANLQRY